MADEISKPIYSFTKAQRFPDGGYTSSKSKSDAPQYNIPDVTKYKYETSHKWRIGTAIRRPITNTEKYAYYDQIYKNQDNLTKFPSKGGKTIGGAIGLDPRIKYDYREKTPGPGRYTPSMKCTKPKSAKYFIGEKTGNSALKLMTGTEPEVGPGKYRPESAVYYSHYQKFPIYSIGRGKRPPLNSKPWTKNETYWIYSSMGNQIQSRKKTEEMVKIGKSTREREKKRGTFKSMMERQPATIRIAMPKF